ncbi:MAG: DegT/DnrJ/EryC1/StrS family aminotransferase [Opitutaceae bacterium]
MSATLRPRPIPGLGCNAFGKEEEELVLDVVRRKEPFRYYGLNPQSPPPMVATLEKEMREFIGVDYALAVSSGTAALEIAYAAIGLGPGDEVIVPAWSWVSCFTAIVRVGARPVLCEIDDTLNFDPSEIDRLITPQTKAVAVIHYQGVAVEMDKIVHAAHRKGLFVVEDCAQSLGATYRGRQIGSWGDVAIFSFQYNKTATCGEGGMVVTRDQRIYERAVRLHDLGNYRPFHAAIVTPKEPAFVGGQFRMSELSAAVALAQVRKIPAIKAHCRKLQSRVLSRITGLPGINLRRVPDPEGDFGFEIYLLFADEAKVVPFQTKLNALNVNCGARTGSYGQYNRDYVKSGLAHHPAVSPFKDFKEWPAPGYRAEDFPRSEALTKRWMALPIGWLYTEEDAEYIGDCIVKVHAEVCG